MAVKHKINMMTGVNGVMVLSDACVLPRWKGFFARVSTRVVGGVAQKMKVLGPLCLKSFSQGGAENKSKIENRTLRK